MENGAVQIYYGEGHGKTNVAIGSAICAACEGKQAVVIQFLKGKKEPEYSLSSLMRRVSRKKS